MTILEKPEFKDLNEEIIKSKDHILGLKNNWDGEGSKQFKKETLDLATNHLQKLSQRFFEAYKLIIHTPNIRPVADLSIDIQWKTEKMELTINFSEEFINLPSFYGKDNEANEIQGILERKKIPLVIFPWLKSVQ